MDDEEQHVGDEHGSQAPAPRGLQRDRGGGHRAEEARGGAGVADPGQRGRPRIAVVAREPEQGGGPDDGNDVAHDEGEGGLPRAEAPLGDSAEDRQPEHDGVVQGCIAKNAPVATVHQAPSSKAGSP